MRYKNIIKSNLKFIIAMSIVVVLGIIGVTFALTYNASIGVNIGTSQLGANITYLNGSSATITSNGSLVPINESSQTINSSTTNSNIVKIDFKVTGTSTNPNNTIMDISLSNISMDCELKSEYFKWKLYKGSELLNTGSFSPKYDTMPNDRLVLTNTQEDLTTGGNTYSLILYLSESCTGDIGTCDETINQDNLLDKSFSATMKIELSTGRSKTNTRTTSTTSACSLTSVSTPTCNTLTYNGSSQTLISSNAKYTLTNATGKDAGNYAVIAKLASGYKWSDGTTSNKLINCTISQKALTIKANNQTITKGNSLSSTTSNITVTGLATGHSVGNIYLSTTQYNVGTGTIIPNGAKIIDSGSNDVTSNYKITYTNGTVTVK